jgi:hypothetical protein
MHQPLHKVALAKERYDVLALALAPLRMRKRGNKN